MAERDWRHLCVVYVFTHRPFVTRLDERAERSERKDAILRENRAARSSEAENDAALLARAPDHVQGRTRYV